MDRSRLLRILSVVILILIIIVVVVVAAGYFGLINLPFFSTPPPAGFPYRGALQVDGQPVEGTCNLQFTLFDSETGGEQIGETQTFEAVEVAEGVFNVQLDFGEEIDAAPDHYLEIASDCGEGSYTTQETRLHLPLIPDPTETPSEPLTATYENLVVVAKSEGDYTSIQAALDDIQAKGDPGPANRYLVWVAPGIYEEQVTMLPYVSIEGAGEAATTITFGGSANPNTGTVIGADQTELRSLTVENTGGEGHAIAIFNDQADITLTDVTASASNSAGRAYSIVNQGGSVTMNNLVVNADSETGIAYGIYNTGSAAVTLTNGTIQVDSQSNEAYGIYNLAAQTTLTNLTVQVSGNAAFGMYNWNATVSLTNATLDTTGASAAYGAHNEYSEITLTYSSFSAAGNTAYGLYNLVGVTANLTDVTVTAEAASGDAYGLYNSDASLTLTSATITAEADSGDAYGVYNTRTTFTLTESTVTASVEIPEVTEEEEPPPPNLAYGIYSLDGSVVVIRNAVISAADHSLYADGEFTTLHVAYSQLTGPLTEENDAAFTCIGNYDAEYKAIRCP